MDASQPIMVELDRATELLREYVVSVQNPKMNPSAEFPLREITPPEVWEQLGWQLFQVEEGPLACETYAIRNGHVERFAGGFGGAGLMSLGLADLDADGAPELAYTWSWGSGVHRTELGVSRVGQDVLLHETASFAFLGDLFVRVHGNVIAVEVGQCGDRFGEWTQEDILGELVVRPGNGRLNPTVRLRDDLEADVRARILGQ